MNRRIISVLIVFLLLASVAIPAVSAETTPIITCEKEAKNLLGIPVGKLVLKGYFDYDHQNAPEGYITEHTAYAGMLTDTTEEHEVVKMHNIKETICRMTVKGKLSVGCGDLLHEQAVLEITCDKNGNTRTDIK